MNASDLDPEIIATPGGDYAFRIIVDQDGLEHIFSLLADSIVEFAIKHRKPHLHLSTASKDNAAQELERWIQQNDIRVLNVAGPRGSKEPTVAEFVITTFDTALKS